MKLVLSILALLPVMAMAPATTVGDNPIKEDCTFKEFKLYGKVKFVEHFPDIKIKYVEHFPDLKVKWVKNFADECGEWTEVEHFPDLKVKVVEHFPDIKVKVVEHFPGRE